MPTASRWGIVALWALGVTFVAPLAGASEGFRRPERGALLQPGESAQVSWRLPADVRADEMELVLSLDGGTSFPIRVTRDLPASATTVRWRVPSLPTPRARLALRAGEARDPDSETILFLSEEFSIVPDPSAATEPLFRAGGEWRTAEARESPDAVPLPFSIEPEAPAQTLRRAPPAPEGAPPRIPLLDRPAPRFDADVRNPPAAAAGASPARTGLISAKTPLRL